MNRYAYCRNNPLIYVDDDGHFFFIPIIVGAVVGAISAEQQGGEWWKGAIIGGLSGWAGAGAGSWAYGLAGKGVTGILAGGVVGGAAGGATGGGLGAAFNHGDIGKGILNGAKYGAIAGGVSAGFVALGVPNAIAAGLGGYASGYAQGGAEAAQSGMWYSFGGAVFGNALAISGLDSDGTVQTKTQKDVSGANESVMTSDRTRVTTPSFKTLDDIIWNMVALLGNGYSHSMHDRDTQYVPEGHKYKSVSPYEPNYKGESYLNNIGIRNNCTTRFGYTFPSRYSAQYNYPRQGAYWW